MTKKTSFIKFTSERYNDGDTKKLVDNYLQSIDYNVTYNDANADADDANADANADDESVDADNYVSHPVNAFHLVSIL